MESPDFDDSLRGPWSKLEGYGARLALILSQLRWAYDPTAGPAPPDVDARDVDGAALLVRYFAAHLRRVRAEVAGAAEAIPGDARAVLRWVRRHGLDSFTASQVNEQFGRFRGRLDRRDAALEWMVDHECVRPRPAPIRTGPGRPQTQAFDVNPHLSGRAINSGNSINRRPPAGAGPIV
jgi:hypothetical protein